MIFEHKMILSHRRQLLANRIANLLIRADMKLELLQYSCPLLDEARSGLAEARGILRELYLSIGYDN